MPKRRATRTRSSVCARERVNYARRGLKGPTPPSWLRTRVQCVHSRARAHSGCTHVRCNVRYAPLLTSLFAADYVRRGWVDADVDYRPRIPASKYEIVRILPFSIFLVFRKILSVYIAFLYFACVYIRISSSQKIRRYYKCNKLQIFLVFMKYLKI